MKVSICFILISIASFSSCKNTSASYAPGDYIITNEDIVLEKEYEEMLSPIQNLKVEEPKIYWFIVSWLNTQYSTPYWDIYSEEWKERTKKRGIDCSGFARVMQDQIFNKQIKGSSKTILKNYCKKRALDDLEMGDLVFFKSNSDHIQRIVHVGIYLQDGYFVHATSSKSAAKGFGLNISSLNQKRWKQEFVTGGMVIKK